MWARVKHEGEYTNGHSYQRIIEYDFEDPPTNADWYGWWDELLFDDTGDGVTEKGVGSYYVATILESDDPELIGQMWEWMD